MDDLPVDGRTYRYVSLPRLERLGFPDIGRLPYSLKVLLENLLRHGDGGEAATADIEDLAGWTRRRTAGREIAFHPARLMMPESSGLPLIADLAAMRDAMTRLGGDPATINPRKHVDIVVDHSVAVDVHGRADSLRLNMEMEYERNAERYTFLRWAQGAFENLQVVPPGAGICHQINLEFLARVVWRDGDLVFPDSLIALDSHTPMINALGVLGWGAGGIEAGAAMLNQPITMRIPEVIGCRLTGKLSAGITATDVALTITQALRARGVVQAFVEFCGPGLDNLTVTNRATIANMAPEYGATTGFFPVDRWVLDYLAETGRNEHHIRLVEAYARAQGFWRDPSATEPVFTDVVEVPLDAIERSLAGPKRPQDRVTLMDAPASARAAIGASAGSRGNNAPGSDRDIEVRNGDVAIAAITSCTNTGNSELMVQAGLVARNARAKGLSSKPWVKTSMGPASRIVAGLLEQAGLQDDLDALGFNVVGFGCTTCVGNSGPLAPAIGKAIAEKNLTVAAVTSANRNFEGRTHPQCRIHYLASPPLVVAYALAGTLDRDLDREPLGMDGDGAPVMLADIWPSEDDIRNAMAGMVTPETYRRRNARIFEGDERWQALPRSESPTHRWDSDSMYLRQPPFLDGVEKKLAPVSDIVGARALVLLGDSVTTDHISPVGTITEDSTAGQYLVSKGIASEQFNSFASRRINHDVMVRGAFANIRIRNHLAPGTEGGVTRLLPENEVVSIHEAALAYRARNVPSVVLAGKDYGAGSSRDWAAKGTYLLGVRAVLAESFERIHRSNLIAMGVVPLEFEAEGGWRALGLDGGETFDIETGADRLEPLCAVRCTVTMANGQAREIGVRCRIDTDHEMEYYRHGGILPYTLRQLLIEASPAPG
jgi:aconitate hydratase